MRKNKKAFTLVELLVVIAIVAILSLATVIGFNVFKKKAYISNDSAILEQVNICLKAQESLYGKPETMNDALKQLADCGYKAVELEPQTKGYHFLYNLKDNKFCLVDEKYNEVYETLSDNEYDNWIIVKNREEIVNADHNFSIYLSNHYEDTYDSLLVERSVGLDTGSYANYKNIEYDIDPKFDGELVLRTNNYSSSIEITADSATFNQYGLANSVIVNIVGHECFNVNGVIGRLKAYEGTVNINKNAEVFYFDASSTNEDFIFNDEFGNVINLVVDPDNTLAFKTDTKLVSNIEGNVLCNHTHGHKLVADDEYVYDVCKECGYVIKAVLKDKGTDNERIVLNAYDLGDSNKMEAAVGEVITYTSVNGETKIQGISFFVGQELGIGYVTDVDKMPIDTYSYDKENSGVFSVSVEDYEGLLIDYDGGVYIDKLGNEETIHPGAIVVRDKETGEITGVAGYVDYSAGEDQDAITEQARQLVEDEIAEQAGPSISGHTHKYSINVSKSKAPTCTTAGYEVHTCSCGSEYTVNLAALGHNYDDDIDGTDQCSRCHENHFFAAGKGVKDDPWIIKTATQLNGITHYYDTTLVRYYEVDKDVDSLDCANVESIYLNGNFDGNGVIFNNLNKCLFRSIGHNNENDDFVIQDFTANMDTVLGHALAYNIWNSGTTTFKDVDVNGYIEGNWNIGTFYNYGTANYDSVGCDYRVVFDNCEANAKLVCASGNTIGYLIGHAYPGAGHKLYLTVNNDTKFKGNVTTDGGFANTVVACAGTDTIVSGAYEKKDVSVNKNNVVKPFKDGGNYKVTLADDKVAYLSVSVTSQLTATDGSGKDVVNLTGITATLTRDKVTISGTQGQNVNVFGGFDSILVRNQKGTTKLDGSTLKVYTGSSNNYTYGTIRLQVNQYDKNGKLLANGTLDIASKKSTDPSWTIK